MNNKLDNIISIPSLEKQLFDFQKMLESQTDVMVKSKSFAPLPKEELTIKIRRVGLPFVSQINVNLSCIPHNLSDLIKNILLKMNNGSFKSVSREQVLNGLDQDFILSTIGYFYGTGEKQIIRPVLIQYRPELDSDEVGFDEAELDEAELDEAEKSENAENVESAEDSYQRKIELAAEEIRKVSRKLFKTIMQDDQQEASQEAKIEPEVKFELTQEFLENPIEFDFKKLKMWSRNGTIKVLKKNFLLNNISTPQDLTLFLDNANPSASEWMDFIIKLNQIAKKNEAKASLIGQGSAQTLLRWMRLYGLIPENFRP